MILQSGLGLAAGTVCLVLLLRTQQKEIALLLGISAGLILFVSASGKASEAVGEILQISNSTWVGDTGALLLKTLGIAYTAQITADICREAGETVLGAQVEFLAKAEIVLLCLPFAGEILEMAEKLLA